MPAVNVERILERADAQLKRSELEHVRRLRRVSNEAYRSLATEVRRRWPDTVDEAAGASRTFAEARARTLLAQLEPYTRALDYGNQAGVARIYRDMIRLGAEAGVEVSTELLRAYGTTSRAGNLAVQTARIDPRAIDAAVRNSQARLAAHSTAARAKIEQAVVNAVVRGQGSQKITREIREAIRGDGKIPDAGLHHRAETIARTELATAKADAARDRYTEVGVNLVQWYATLDERVCPYCGYRHGMVYPRDELIIPAHPRCRCYAAPFRREFVDAGLVDVTYWRDSQAEVRTHVKRPKVGATPFEEAQGRSYPRAAWTPSSGWVA